MSIETKICEVPVDELRSFKDHPYKVIDDGSMTDLAESIRERGVIVPIVVRPIDEGGYEIISGHRRAHAAKLLGIDRLPAKVMNIDRSEATVLMVDSNCQRENILPSERAFAYKMKYDALKRQGVRTDIDTTLRPLGAKLRDNRTDELLSAEGDDSARQIQRYLRLTHLVPELLEFVDSGKMKMRPAVEISYLDEEAQRDLVDRIDETESFPSHDQAIRMRRAFEEGRLDYERVCEIMAELKPNQKPAIRLKLEDLGGYFREDDSQEKILRDIRKGLDLLKKQRSRDMCR